MKKALHSILAVAAIAAVGLGGLQTAFAAEKKTYILPAEKPGSLAILLGVDKVQKDLGLSSLQRSVLDSIRKEYRDASRTVVGNAGDSVESKKAAQRKLDALTRRTDARALSTLSPAQRTRLAQIEAQALGGTLLYSRKVQQKLGLTDDQKLEIAKLHTKGLEYISEVNGWYENGEVSNYERILYLREDRESRGEDLLEVLTPAQLKEFEALQGEPFVKV